MKFDVVIGNPPYQLTDGGAGASAKPIYHLFIEQSKKLNPRYIVMITPSRWFAGGKGLDKFRKTMIEDTRIKEIHDFEDASECFPGVEIKGGVNYFLWDRNYRDKCKFNTYKNGIIVSSKSRFLRYKNSEIVIRYNEGIDILDKVLKHNEESFSTLVSSRKPFGLPTNFSNYNKERKSEEDIKIYSRGEIGWIGKDFKIPNNKGWVGSWKIYIPEAIGSGNMKEDLVKPILGSPNTCSTETYVMVGPLKNKKEAQNIISYISTKFFHFMLGLKKITHHTTSKVYEYIPIQDFSKPWTDKELYEKYNLTDEEINFIETTIRSMDE